MSKPSIRRSANKPLRSPWFLLVEVLFVVTLLANMVIYGGIPSLPEVGPILERSIGKQASPISLYMQVGTLVVQIPGVLPVAHELLQGALRDGYAEISGDPGNALLVLTDRTHNTLHGLLHLLRWLTPICFVLSLIGLVLQPRRFTTFGKR